MTDYGTLRPAARVKQFMHGIQIMHGIVAVAILGLPAAAFSQGPAPVVLPRLATKDNSSVVAQGSVQIDSSGVEKGTDSNPTSMKCVLGCGSGGGGSSAVFSRDPYVATASGSGFASGDHLAKITTATTAGTSPTTFWFNDTQGSVLASAPPLSSISQLSLPAGNNMIGGVDIVIKGTAIDRGALVGTTAATLAPINAARRGWAMQVQASASVSCYVNGSGTATADYHSLQVGGGGFYQSPDGHVGTGALSVICSAANTPVYMREW